MKTNERKWTDDLIMAVLGIVTAIVSLYLMF